MKTSYRILAALVAGLIGGGISWWVGAQSSDTVVSGLQLVVGNGKTYAEISKSGRQTAKMAFYNASGKVIKREVLANWPADAGAAP